MQRGGSSDHKYSIIEQGVTGMKCADSAKIFDPDDLVSKLFLLFFHVLAGVETLFRWSVPCAILFRSFEHNVLSSTHQTIDTTHVFCIFKLFYNRSTSSSLQGDLT